MVSTSTKTSARATSKRSPKSVQPIAPPTRCGGAYRDRGINYSFRISQDMRDRIQRVIEVLGPRFQSFLGRLPHDADVARAVMDRGLSAIELEYDIGGGKEGYVLVDSLEDFEEP